MKSNVLLITCDQLRKDALGCFGNDVVHTPHIDRLAREGVRFNRIFTASPVCGPNRASMATGRYPSVHGVWCNGIELPDEELTFMEVFRRHGYATYGTGKMHFGPQWRQPTNGAALGNGEPSPALAVNPQPSPEQFPWHGFEQVILTEDNRVGPYGDYLQAHGYDVWADPHSFSYPQHQTVRSSYPREHHQTAWIADRAIDFLDQHDADRPFLLWTSFVHPHHPFNPPAPYDALYEPDEMPSPVWDPAEVERWPESLREKYTQAEGSHEAIGMCHLTDRDWQRVKAFYYGMVSFIDEQVGRLLAYLDQHGLRENTTIVFTADHGELLGDHHLLFKQAMFDCVTNVPMIVASPQMRETDVERDLFGNSIDLMPTLLDLAGLPCPETVQGASLVPAIADDAWQLRDDELIESMTDHRALRTDDALLVWHGPGRRGELYDLRRDPHALCNLWEEPAWAERRAALLDRLMERLVRNRDPQFSTEAMC